MTDHKCGGNCCKRFILQDSPVEIKQKYDEWVSSGRPSSGYRPGLWEMGGGVHDVQVDPEIYLLYPMLIYLGKHDWEPYAPRKKGLPESHHYTCKHFDKKTKLCTIYDIRPSMCRRYPNTGICLFPGCEISGNKKKLRDSKRRTASEAVRKDKIDWKK